MSLSTTKLEKKSHTYTRLFFLTLLVIASLSVAVWIVQKSHQVNADVSGSNWRVGHIIDDSIFYNNSDFSVQDVQNFLNGKVPTCDTNGTQIATDKGSSMTHAQYAASKGWAAPPYICLKDYYQVPRSDQVISNFGTNTIPDGAVSAASIIKTAADTYGVNPKVLIVTLQKESDNLLNDNWPVLSQYTNSMGYGCPDTAACDPQYAGFYNQVMNAARQFKLYKDNPANYRYKPYQNNAISYQANNTSCGSSTVFIETSATAGLYNYTPYQPNQPALNNMYGLGDSCSAYGNRNFWRNYIDWFGSTAPSYAANSPYSKATCNIPAYNTDMVGRLYNPDLKDYFYTTSQSEACKEVRLGYIWDGLVFKNYVPDTDTVPVYRLSNPIRHVFTSSATVRDDYINNKGYLYEGIAYYAKTTATGNIAVYCLTNSTTQAVVYTSASGEIQNFLSEGYTNAGISYYTTPLSTSLSQVFRLSRGAHRFYTTSSYEKDMAQIFYGFTWETNSTFNASKYPDANLTPVYRLSAPNRHFYTTNRGERDTAVLFYGYTSEGTEFYAYNTASPADNTPVNPIYRMSDVNGNRLFSASPIEKSLAISNYGYSDEGIGWYVKQ